MSSLRIENDAANTKIEELEAKVKTLDQENLAKEQEITSLNHQKQLLETEVEKLEANLKDAKSLADESQHHGTQNEALTRRLQLLEDEAEEADKNVRETNEKYVKSSRHSLQVSFGVCANQYFLGSAKLTSRLATLSVRLPPLKQSVMLGRKNTKRWRRNTRTQPRLLKTSGWRSKVYRHIYFS